MKRATAGLLPLITLGCIAAPSLAAPRALQAPAGGADSQKLQTALEMVRARNAREYAITTPNAIDEARYVEVGGIEQWITIRGEDRSNPVLLFLHGGPGDATNPWGYAAFRLWLRHFTVVQWDQRGAGRTLGRNSSASSPAITVNRMVQDGVELAALLARTLRKNKIVLVGHSWGSTLGVLMAKARPDLFYAFVGTGQVADPAKNYAVAYDALVRKAGALQDERALRELRTVGPPPYPTGQGFAVQRRWANFFEGADFSGVYAARHQRLVRGAGAQRRAPGARNERARGQSAQRRLRRAGVRDPGRGGLHHADEPGACVRERDSRAVEGIRHHSRGTLRGVHEARRVRRASGVAGPPAGPGTLTWPAPDSKRVFDKSSSGCWREGLMAWFGRDAQTGVPPAASGFSRLLLTVDVERRGHAFFSDLSAGPRPRRAHVNRRSRRFVC
jgi:pimeloyl-ACP methyl ester carboxylesterase